MLFPQLTDVAIERVEHPADTVLVWVSSTAREVACPTCGLPTSRVHSHYDRRVADAAIAGQTVALRLRARRFLCDNKECAVRTFTE